jgi:hypothetical protein
MLTLDKELNMKHKVGDKVRVKTLEQLHQSCNIKSSRYFKIINSNVFIDAMQEYCGKIVTIKDISSSGISYLLEEICFCWQDWMFDENFKEEPIKAHLTRFDCSTTKIIINSNIIKRPKVIHLSTNI